MARRTGIRKLPAGFTLIEVVVVIAVISILASMAVPYASKLIDSARETTTRQRMQDLYKTIMGDPATGTFGFVGDMGRLPNGGVGALAQLNTRNPAGLPAQPLPPGAALPVAELGIQRGWNGPYFNSGFDPLAYVNDAWGRALRYGPAAAAAPFPVLQAGQIYSAGADGVGGTADDFTYPSGAVNINGRLLVNLFVYDNGVYVLNPTRAQYPTIAALVTIYYSNNGAQGWQRQGPGVIPPTDPPYLFGQAALLPGGIHAVQGTCTLPTRPPTSGQAVVTVPSNNQLTVLNLYLR